MLAKVKNSPFGGRFVGEVVKVLDKIVYVRFLDSVYVYERDDVKIFNKNSYEIGDEVWVLVYMPGTDGKIWCKATILQDWSGHRMLISFADGSGEGVFFKEDLRRFPDLTLSAKVQVYE